MSESKSLKYLYDLLPNIQVNYNNYTDSERKDITPALEKLGYKVLGWKTGEKDSCGPLSRVADTLDPSGNQCQVWYG